MPSTVDKERLIREIDATSTRSLDPLLEAAANHADATGEPDHEVGDIIAILRASWLRMTTSQRRAILDEFAYLLEEHWDPPCRS